MILYIYTHTLYSTHTNMSSYSTSEWTVVCNNKKKKTSKTSKTSKSTTSLMNAPLMKLSGIQMSIRVMSVENCEIRPKTLYKKMKRGGLRTRLTKMLRSAGTTFITRQMIDKLIEAEKMKKHHESVESEKDLEDVVDDEDTFDTFDTFDQVTEPDSKNVENEPDYGMVRHYFDAQNLSVVSPDGVVCSDVLEKAARISAWWTRVLGYKVY